MRHQGHRLEGLGLHYLKGVPDRAPAALPRVPSQRPFPSKPKIDPLASCVLSCLGVPIHALVERLHSQPPLSIFLPTTWVVSLPNG